MDELSESEMDHVIVLGWNEFSRLIVEELIHSQNQVYVVQRPEDGELDLSSSYPGVVVHHDALADLETLRRLRPEKARAVFLNLPSDDDNLVLVVRLKKMFAEVEYVVVLRNEDLKQTFRTAGVTWPLSRHEVSSKVVAGLMYEPDVADLMLELLAATRADGDYDLQQYKIGPNNKWGTRTFGEAFQHFQTEYNVMPIALARKSDDGFEHVKIPPPETRLSAGDYLIFVTSQAAEIALEREFRTREGRTTKNQAVGFEVND